MKRKIGTDPEFFINKKGDSTVIPARGIIGGTKNDPKDIGSCFVHEDNVAMELTFAPSENEDEFVDSLTNAIKEAEDELGVSIVKKATHEFTNKQLDYLEARQFGCSSDIDAFTMEDNDAVETDGNLRSCGGHLHIDLDFNSDNARAIVLFLDLHLGVPSVLLDKDSKRRSLYGKASSFRFTSYGIEYRSLSNFWCYNEKYIRWVYSGVHKAIEESFNIPLEDFQIKEIRECINNSDIEKAKELVAIHQVNIPD